MATGPGSLTAPRPNPDLVTVPSTAHPPLRPRPLTLSLAQTPAQAASAQEGHPGWRGRARGPRFAEHLLCAQRSAEGPLQSGLPARGSGQTTRALAEWASLRGSV